MFVVSMKANRGLLVAVAAVGVAMAMLLTQCGESAPASSGSAEANPTLEMQGETDGTTG